MGPVAPPQGFVTFIYVMLILLYGVIPITAFAFFMWFTKRLPMWERLVLSSFVSGLACFVAVHLADWYWFAQRLW